jgi:hypothetical protein
VKTAAESTTSGLCRSLPGVPEESRISISDHIFAFDVFPENRLVISRGNSINDVVLSSRDCDIWKIGLPGIPWAIDGFL